MGISDKLFGSYTVQNRKKVRQRVDRILSMQSRFRNMSDEDLMAMTSEFRRRLLTGETKDDIMEEAFAVCREATRRKLGMEHYPVQLEAAIAMQDNAISEMKTGEGKTLVQILNAYLNAISGEGVHVITSNEYLAERDANQNRAVFEYLGLSCGFVAGRPKMTRQDRKEQYKSDIVYATASTLAFDYLDDNQVKYRQNRVFNRPFNYAIVDEVDSILLDDGMTPLIKVGNMPGDDSKEVSTEVSDLYIWATSFIKNISCTVEDQEEVGKYKPFTTDCIMFKDTMEVVFTERMNNKIEKAVRKEFGENISEIDIMTRHEAIKNALIARHHFTRGKHYEIKPTKKDPKQYEIVLISESLGRFMEGRRLSEGLHEAIEAKERLHAIENRLPYNIQVHEPSVTTATCTYPDFFGLYHSGISGMTGTSNAEDFMDIYGMPTYEVPSRKPNMRVDLKDEIYTTKQAKYKAIVAEILRCQKTLQPVLVGTDSVEESKIISKMLEEAGVRHQLLNAVDNEHESQIVANAGLLGKVTVTTNMAGRGTDIKLGEGVREVGGLYVIGTSKNRNRRIDNQLRGRAARQGDPGQTKYFASLEDNMVAIRCGTKLRGIIEGIKTKAGLITNKMIASLVDKCQLSQESHDKQARMTSEKIGRVLTDHKRKIYEQRNRVLECDDMLPMLNDVASSYAQTLSHMPMEEIEAKVGHLVDLSKLPKKAKKEEIEDYIREELVTKLKGVSTTKGFNSETRKKMLLVIDTYWVGHIDYLKRSKIGASLQAYAQRNPLEEYEYQAYQELNRLTPLIQNEFITYALNPEMKFGTYEVKEIDLPEESYGYSR